MPGKYVNLSEGGKYLKCKNDDYEDLQQFDNYLECDECNYYGSYFIIGEKYKIGLCLKCLIEHSPYYSIIGLKGYIVKDD